MSFSRAYYSASIGQFRIDDDNTVLSALVTGGSFAIESTQRDAWLEQIAIMRVALEKCGSEGLIAFEFTVPRIGGRIDVLLIVQHVIFVFEFKVGESAFTGHASDQVWDYALDLKNFHSTSHDKPIVPVLVATRAAESTPVFEAHADQLFRPVRSLPNQIESVIDQALLHCSGPNIDVPTWKSGRYTPTPTIIEAAMALYGGHRVEEISRSDGSAINLSKTSKALAAIIENARAKQQKAICFVTGVPGAGKTLVGLNIAARYINHGSDLYSVFLSGNGPLVSILCEALARDKARRQAPGKSRQTLGQIRSEVKSFIQNVHHFRDDCIRDTEPPVEHVALFDEAQRAWNFEQTASFMRRKKGLANFSVSESKFLISCMNRHRDWAVVVCLVGGGQEINTGEAGIGEWIRSINTSFPDWHVYLSPNLTDSEYAAGGAIDLLEGRANVHLEAPLHLAVSMRSFRAEHVSSLVKSVLDLDIAKAKQTWNVIRRNYPIVLSRDLNAAKKWLKSKARGTERYGIVTSSQAQRLKPHAIDVRSPVDPIHWFLHPKDDVRSSYFLEDVATEFHVQGLELDWTCLVWDGDYRFSANGWSHWSFRGTEWQRIRQVQRQAYLKNAYRVLLTRARQGMAIVVPPGDQTDATRSPAFYDSTFEYLKEIGFDVI
jgi:hypothetical protein